jgi:HK97 family phage portal protein
MGAPIQNFIRKYIWDDSEKRGYPLTGDSAGWHKYLNDIASSSFPNGTPIYGQDFAMRIATVFICVLVRAESLASLPASVKQSTPQGSKVAYNNPVHYLLHDRPNPFQTASDFWKMVSAHIDLHGNCFAIITYSGRFQVKRIDIIDDPDAVEVLKTESNNPVYRHDGKDYRDYEILHFKDLSIDGYRGCSKVGYNRETLRYAQKLRR